MIRGALRILAGGLAGGIAWIASMFAAFGPAQRILADPALQSEKFYGVMADPINPPRMAEAFWIVPAGLMVIALFYSAVFAVLAKGLPGRTPTRKGLVFGLCAWALGFTWFEFYLPWNVMREPAALVTLELACWLAVMLAVGLTLSWVHHLSAPSSPDTTAP